MTLVGEADRKLLKAAIKHSSSEDQVRHRQVPTEVLAKWAQKLAGLKEEISEILQEEKEEKHVSVLVLHRTIHGQLTLYSVDRFAKLRWSSRKART